MREAEWLTSHWPGPMVERLADRQHEPAVGRKLLLFAACCCRNVLRGREPPEALQALEALERLADGLMTSEDFEPVSMPIEALAHARSHDWGLNALVGAVTRAPRPLEAAWHAADTAQEVARLTGAGTGDGMSEAAFQVALLRDIFGNPFRPAEFPPEWRTDTAVSLARQMYESRDFSAMPILADALQDAGCENIGILGHCRDTSRTHVRGCWVVDLVLNKS